MLLKLVFDMEKLKIVSVRLSDSEIEKLDRAADSLHYYKRSDIIRAAVQLATSEEFKPFLGQLVRFHPEYGDEIKEVTFKMGRKNTGGCY